MKLSLATLALVLLATGSTAQVPCNDPGVSVTVTPACAAPGSQVLVTLTNLSSQTITLPSSCTYAVVRSGSLCSGPPVFSPVCLTILVPIPPGQSSTMPWDQTDDLGLQVPDGVYSFEVHYYGAAGLRSCCADVLIGPPSFSYCAGKPNSQGCLPLIGSSGTPSVSDPNPFLVSASQVVNQKNGLLFYGFAQASIPFGGGLLCVQPPITRLPVQFSRGNPPPDDCSGSYAFDMNAHIQSGVDPLLTAGASADAQYWYRDPAHPDGTGIGLSGALEFCIQN